jgi:hypothetical protein
MAPQFAGESRNIRDPAVPQPQELEPDSRRGAWDSSLIGRILFIFSRRSSRDYISQTLSAPENQYIALRPKVLSITRKTNIA